LSSQSRVLEKLIAIQQVKFRRGKNARRNMILYNIFEKLSAQKDAVSSSLTSKTFPCT
jgi:hypothetical protein